MIVASGGAALQSTNESGEEPFLERQEEETEIGHDKNNQDSVHPDNLNSSAHVPHDHRSCTEPTNQQRDMKDSSSYQRPSQDLVSEEPNRLAESLIDSAAVSETDRDQDKALSCKIPGGEEAKVKATTIDIGSKLTSEQYDTVSRSFLKSSCESSAGKHDQITDTPQQIHMRGCVEITVRAQESNQSSSRSGKHLEALLSPKEIIERLRILSSSIHDADMSEIQSLKLQLSKCLRNLRDCRLIVSAIESVSLIGLKSAADSELLHALMRESLKFAEVNIAGLVSVLCEYARANEALPDTLFSAVCNKLEKTFKGLSTQDLSRLFWALGTMRRVPNRSLAESLADFVVIQLRKPGVVVETGALCNISVALSRLDQFPRKFDAISFVMTRFEASYHIFSNQQLVDILEAFASMKVLVPLSLLTRIASSLTNRQASTNLTMRQGCQLLFSLHCLGCKLEGVIPAVVRAFTTSSVQSKEFPTTLVTRLLFVLSETRHFALTREVFEKYSTAIFAGINTLGFEDFRNFLIVIVSSDLMLPLDLRCGLAEEFVRHLSDLQGRDVPCVLNFFIKSSPESLGALLRHIQAIKRQFLMMELEKCIAALCSVDPSSWNCVVEVVGDLCCELHRVRDRFEPPSLARILHSLGKIAYVPGKDVMKLLVEKGVQLAPRFSSIGLSQSIYGFYRLGCLDSKKGGSLINILTHEIAKHGGDFTSRDAAKLYVELCPSCDLQDTGDPLSIGNSLILKVLKDLTLPSTEDLVGVLSILARDDPRHFLSQKVLKILQHLAAHGILSLSGVTACRLLFALAAAGVNPLPSAMPCFIERIHTELANLSAQDVCTALCSIADLNAEPSFESTVDFALSALKPFTLRGTAEWCRDWESGPRCGVVGDSCDALWSLAVLSCRWSVSGQLLFPVASGPLNSTIRSILSSISKAFFATYGEAAKDQDNTIKFATLQPLYRLYAFFTYLHITNPEFRKILVDCDENTFKLAGISHCTFINAARDSVAEPTITATEARCYAAELGLKFEYGASLDDCGYIPSLINYERRLILEIGDPEHVILGPDERASFRGTQKLKIRHLQALGWQVISFTRSEWEQIARKEGPQPGGLLRKAFLLEHHRLRDHLPSLEGGDRNIVQMLSCATAGEQTVVLLERVFCLDGHLLSLPSQNLPSVLEKILFYPQHLSLLGTAADRALERIHQLLVPGGLEERVSCTAHDLDFSSLNLLMTAVTSLAALLAGRWQSKRLLTVLAELACTKVRRGVMDSEAICHFVNVCGSIHGYIDIEFFNPMVLAILGACNGEVVESLKPPVVIMIYFVVCKSTKAIESRPEAVSLSGCLAERAAKPDVMISLDERDLPLMVEACNQLSVSNSRLLRALAERGREILDKLSPAQLVLLVHGLARLELGLENILELLHQRSLSPKFLQALSLRETILLLWTYAKVGSEDHKVVRALIKKILHAAMCSDDPVKGLACEMMIDLLWSFAFHGLVLPTLYEGKLWAIQTRMCEHLAVQWKEGLVAFSHSDERGSHVDSKQTRLSRERVSIFRQYLVATQQQCRNEISVLSSEFAKMSADVIRFSLAVDKRLDLHDIRQGVRDSLRSFGVETDEGLELCEIGYVLGLKLRGQATSIEIYGRADCVESLRDRLPRPNGLWALRQKQLSTAGLTVVAVGYNQWESLVSGHSSANRAQWLQKLLAASTWAVNLDSSTAPQQSGTEFTTGNSSHRISTNLKRMAPSEGGVGIKRRKEGRAEMYPGKAQEASVSPIDMASFAEQSDAVAFVTSEEGGDFSTGGERPAVSGDIVSASSFDAGAREDALRQTKKRIKVHLALELCILQNVLGNLVMNHSRQS